MRAVLVAIVMLGCACGRLRFDPTADPLDAESSVHSSLHLDRVDPGEQMFDFPLMVVLDDTRADRTRLQADASDLAFYDTSNVRLRHEIEQVGAPGGAPLIAWVRIPLYEDLSTAIEVRYGGDPLAPTASPWPDTMRAVWHFPDCSLGDSIMGHDGTGTAVAPTTGAIGTACDFTGASSIEVADSPSLEFPALTATGWILQRTRGSPYQSLVTRAYQNMGLDDFYLGAHSGLAYAGVTSTFPAQIESFAGAFALGTWAHLAVTIDATTMQLYLDGVLEDQQTPPGSPNHSAHSIFLGADCNYIGPGCPDDDFLDGSIDEVRLDSVVRSPAWIAIDHFSQLDQLITYGPIEH
jgi:hypothetical protein